MKEHILGISEAIKLQLKVGKGGAKIAENFFWLFSHKVIQLIVGLFVTSCFARFLGQESFGIWNYSLAFIVIFSAFSTLGLDTIIIRDVVRNPTCKNQILGSSFFLKIVSSVIAFVISVTTIHFVHPSNDIVKWMVTIMAISLLFQATDVIDFYFKSQMQSYYVVYARSLSFLIIAVSQLILIIKRAPLIGFAWLFSLESILDSLLLIVFYKLKCGGGFCWTVDKKVTIQLLKNGWPLFIAFISSMLYLKVDQIMIGQILGERAVGVFSAALKIYEIPFSFLVLLTATSFPKLVETYQQDKELFFKRYSQVTSFYTAGSLIVLLIIILFGKQIIYILFGSGYVESYLSLVILSIGLVFVYNGMLRSSYLSITNNEKIIFYTSLMSAIMNLILNYILIQRYGIAGSAVATLITHFFAIFLSNYFFKATKRIYFIQLEAFFKFTTILAKHKITEANR